jgi:hypothetical protein
MDRYTKAQRKKLRRLKDIAYERELDQALEKLSKEFRKWRNKEVDGFELNDLIHKHHQGVSREIWKFYTYADPDMAVARAVNQGLLKKEDIPGDILEIIDARIDFFSRNDES